MIRLCSKLLSTGSAMMWEGGRQRERGREREERREAGLQMAASVTPLEGGRDGEQGGREGGSEEIDGGERV